MRAFRRFVFYVVAITCAFFCSGRASAQAVVLTFEGLHHFESVNNYYDGLFGANNGSYAGPLAGPGPNLGIVFTTPNAPNDHGGQALLETGVLSNFMNEPSFQTILFDLNNDLINMTVADRFTGPLSFWYTGDAAGAVFHSITIAGPNGPIVPQFVADTRGYTVNPPPGELPMAIVGTSVHLPPIPNAPQFDPNTGNNVGNTVWDKVTIGFPGVAQIVSFQGIGNHFGIDDVGFAIVPEPATVTLLLMTVAALSVRREKSRTG